MRTEMYAKDPRTESGLNEDEGFWDSTMDILVRYQPVSMIILLMRLTNFRLPTSANALNMKTNLLKASVVLVV